MSNQKTIGETVAADYRTAAVFKQFGIDFCCGGKRSIEQVCLQKGIDPVLLEQALEQAQRSEGRPAMNPDAWELSFLADYIVNKHHVYVQERLPQLVEYADKVARVHGEKFPPNLEVAALVSTLRDELTAHMLKEEKILFPYVKVMEKARKAGHAVPVPSFGTAAGPVNVMEAEHEVAGEILSRLREITGDYALPAEACNTWRVLWSLLAEFEEDLHEHVHLENNILFPKALEMEHAFAKPL
ncbi:MAG: iron-sulfur cluster repair di-iron protein [Saprospiraceae bacterium]|nr:iron-sulfur cluster repair di-iron protein [Saprospiraceae bacterium]